jgi:dTDP-4-amino-4,6-dideoxygalactose transaminase
MNMDVDQLGAALTDSTIVVATHQYGIPCDIERIQQLCTDHGAFLLEDCAAALGTCINGRPAGTFGTAAFFSFDSTKLIHVPMKAGFVGTNNLDLHNRIEALSATVLRPMGIARKLTLLFQALILLSLESPILYRLFHALRFGLRGQYTSETSELSLELTPFHINQMSEWQAKIAVEQLGGVGNLVHQRQAVYNVMREALSNCTKFCLPPADSNCEWAPIRFPILCQNNKFDVYRAGNRRGIDFAFSFTNISCPTTMIHARLYASQVLDLPFYFKLSERDLTKVIQVVGALGQ